MDDGDERAEFGLEDGVKVVGATSCDEAVAVGEFGEDTDVVGVFVLDSVCHLYSFIIISTWFWGLNHFLNFILIIYDLSKSFINFLKKG